MCLYIPLNPLAGSVSSRILVCGNISLACTQTHTHIHRMYTYMYTYLPTYTYIHACIHTYTYIHTHIYIHTNIHTHIHTHKHTYAHTHQYIHTYNIGSRLICYVNSICLTPNLFLWWGVVKHSFILFI